jgi:hypothetical protein
MRKRPGCVSIAIHRASWRHRVLGGRRDAHRDDVSIQVHVHVGVEVNVMYLTGIAAYLFSPAADPATLASG